MNLEEALTRIKDLETTNKLLSTRLLGRCMPCVPADKPGPLGYGDYYDYVRAVRAWCRAKGRTVSYLARDEYLKEHRESKSTT